MLFNEIKLFLILFSHFFCLVFFFHSFIFVIFANHITHLFGMCPSNLHILQGSFVFHRTICGRHSLITTEYSFLSFNFYSYFFLLLLIWIYFSFFIFPFHFRIEFECKRIKKTWNKYAKDQRIRRSTICRECPPIRVIIQVEHWKHGLC